MTSKWQDEGYVSGEEGVSAESEGDARYKRSLLGTVSAWYKFKNQSKCQDVVDHAEEQAVEDGDKEEVVKEGEEEVVVAPQKMQPPQE